MPEISEFIEQSIVENAKHGLRGDRTLECVAAGFKHGTFVKSKFYYEKPKAARGRKDSKPENSSPLLETEPCRSYYERFLKAAEEITGFVFSDIGKFSTENSLVYAMNFNAMDVERNCFGKLAAFFTENLEDGDKIRNRMLTDIERAAELLDKQVPPLADIGIKFDEKGKLLAVKYYLELRRSTTSVTCFDEKCCSLIKQTSPEADTEKLTALAKTLEKSEFLPVLTAVTVKSDGSRQQKIYFDAGSSKIRKYEVLENARKLMKNLDYPQLFSDSELEKMHEGGLYLRGFGVNAVDTDEVKLYFDKLAG